MTTDVVAAYLRKNTLPSAQIAEIIEAVYRSLRTLEARSGEPVLEAQKPAVPIRKSVHPDFLVCLEDGKKLKMLKRHLRSSYRLTPDQYRHKWGLPPDYPMVAPNYADQRSAFARKIGLGRTGRKVAKRALPPAKK
ncbi:MAG TPA: MucR family transcriptional regulator [Stellaceae bacterium]|nr:MucR family transcriptional regulator [Stellaceae bacterium]